MRAVGAVASCIGVGLVLQGCGEGGSTPDKTSCLAKNLDVVSQTLSGKVDVAVDVTMDGITMSNKTEATFKAMFDFEKFNMRLDASGESPDGGKMTATTIFDAENRQVIGYESADVGGHTTKNCSIAKLPESFPPAAQLAIMLNTLVKPFLAEKAKCGGNDGTYDTWQFSYNFTGDLPPMPVIPDDPLPSLDGVNIKDGSVQEDVQMSKEQLLHSSATRVSGELLNKTVSLGSLTMTTSIVVDDAKRGGPAAADLDPSQFDVECTKIDPSDVPRGFAHQGLLRIMEASQNSQHAVTV